MYDDISNYPKDALQELHVPCVLLVDTSTSMAGANIECLNHGLKQFKKDLLCKYIGKSTLLNSNLNLDIAIVEFNSEARVVHNFAQIDALNIPKLQASGLSAMGTGMRKALALIEQRKLVYRDTCSIYAIPLIFMFTAGNPTDEDECMAIFRQLQQKEDKLETITSVIGIGNYNEGLLRQIMPFSNTELLSETKNRQRIYRLSDVLDFADIFQIEHKDMIYDLYDYKAEELPFSLLKPADEHLNNSGVSVNNKAKNTTSTRSRQSKLKTGLLSRLFSKNK